ncbi:MAG: endo-1,4-beta-xylanase [Alphaproteobacteria bacterium]|nr:endo-1,4-beta-xylanase [Alphaproteobacteria bacterium]
MARKKGRLYGAAVKSSQLNDHRFAEALKREVALLVPEGELKWDALRPSPAEFDFSGYHRLAQFAQANSLAMRGHVLVWHHANPSWLVPELKNKKTAEKILRAHIERVVAETSPMIRNWDVVNEAIDPRSPRKDGLRETLWLKALGPNYISQVFHYAHQVDPGLTLVYNDFGLERGDGYGYAKRKLLLNLLKKLKTKNVPIHALGLQSHLRCHLPLGGRDFTEFLKTVRGLGIEIYITELDLDLSRVPGEGYERSTFAQNYVQTYLAMVQESGSVNTLLTWGLSDRRSWLEDALGDAQGSLPLDTNYQRGPLWESLRSGWLRA